MELYLLGRQPALVLHPPDDRLLRGQRVRIVDLESREEQAPLPESPHRSD